MGGGYEELMEYLYGKLKTLEREESPLEEAERLRAASGPLLYWYDRNRRILPWREEPEAYRVWISEIMLQQTRVEAVKPYFARFMEALPDIKSLAQVEEQTLLKLWEGLGYYNRARNLKKAAQVIVEEYGAVMPDSYEKLIKLPGIGSYTAGAVASIAFGIPEPAVDGNVLRVLSRLLADREDIGKAGTKKRFEDLIRDNMDRERAGDYNQALIELGAIVCIPAGKPLCAECPLHSICLARREELTEIIPVKAPKKPRRIEDKTVFLLEWEDRAAIRKRSSKGLLASLYEFPNIPGHAEAGELKEQLKDGLGLPAEEILSVEKLADSVHIFSHVEWHMTGYRVKIANEHPELFKMVKKEEIFSKYPLPNAFGVYTKALM